MSSPEIEDPSVEDGIKKVLDLYATGKPLFTRAVLEDLNRHIDEGKERIKIKNYIDGEQELKLTVPKRWYEKIHEKGTPRLCIGYNCIESLTNPMPTYPDMAEISPLAILYSYTPHCLVTSEELRDAFEHRRQAWLESETYRCFTEQLRMLTPQQVAGITKIVGFGLGELGGLDKGNTCQDRHSLVQHAAIQTIADVLKEKNSGREVNCYAQDPANQGVGDEFLKTIGIMPLDDPKAFLEVDENTFVVSINPNVPVRQIVCDVQWPKAMLWNTVKEEEHKVWRTEVFEDRTTWVSPYTTDPSSKRVINMVEHYVELPFNNVDGYFGDLTMYVRKS